MRVKTTLFVLLSVLVLAGLLMTEYTATHGPGSISVAFCPECQQLFLSKLSGGQDVHCALYDNGKLAATALAAAHAQVITDDETTPSYGTPYKHSGLMHDKFCIINDSIVFTGSYNPTDGGELNQNNVLIIQSKALSHNYELEFQSMATRTERDAIQHVLWINGTRVENYFCPLDECESHVLERLSQAKSSVLFMTYSFTSDPIGKLLLQKQAQDVSVAGVCDPSQNDAYTECIKLGAKTYNGSGLMHHKVFIIDNTTVITGSYNPTASADRSNRENILIIDSPAIAQQYMQEYQRVAAQAQ